MSCTPASRQQTTATLARGTAGEVALEPLIGLPVQTEEPGSEAVRFAVHGMNAPVEVTIKWTNSGFEQSISVEKKLQITVRRAGTAEDINVQWAPNFIEDGRDGVISMRSKAKGGSDYRFIGLNRHWQVDFEDFQYVSVDGSPYYPCDTESAGALLNVE